MIPGVVPMPWIMPLTSSSQPFGHSMRSGTPAVMSAMSSSAIATAVAIAAAADPRRRPGPR